MKRSSVFCVILLIVACATPSPTLAPQRHFLPLPFIRLSTQPVAAQVTDDETVRRWNDLAVAAAEWVTLMNGGVYDAKLWRRIQDRAKRAGLCEEKR